MLGGAVWWCVAIHLGVVPWVCLRLCVGAGRLPPAATAADVVPPRACRRVSALFRCASSVYWIAGLNTQPWSFLGAALCVSVSSTLFGPICLAPRFCPSPLSGG